MVAFNGLPEHSPGPQEVTLADEFVQCPGPHSVGKRRLSLEVFPPVALEKAWLLFSQ